MNAPDETLPRAKIRTRRVAGMTINFVSAAAPAPKRRVRTRAAAAEILTRRAPLAAATWNAEAGTFEVVLSSGAAVERHDFQGAYDEILSLSQAWPDTVPLLDSHQRESVDHRLGSVDRLKTVGGELRGLATLSRHNPKAQRIAAELTDGQSYGVSIGYQVRAWSERTNQKTKRREKIATAFDLVEASLVVIPADRQTGIRGSNMTDTTATAVEPGTTTPAAPTLDRAAVNAEIRSIARIANLDQAWTDAQIDAGATAEAARAAAFDTMRTRGTPTIRNTAPEIGADHTDPREIRSAMAGALAHRMAPDRIKLEGRAAEYRGHDVLGMIGELAQASGERINLRDRGALIERAVGAHSSSDFPLLLADAANRTLLASYQAAAPTYRSWAAPRPFTDFRDHSFLRVGDFPRFQDTNENGEVKFGTISENREKVRAKQLDAGIIIGRQALINDDLSALGDFSSMIAIRAASDENARVYALLAANGDLSDGVALFHATHGNLAGAGSAISVTSVAAAVAALRKQTGLDEVPLNLAPRFLVVGPDKELEGRQVLAAITSTKAADVNPWSGVMELVVDSNITGNAWYVMADPAAAPTVVYGYVNGTSGPEIRTERDFDTRAVKVAAGLDFGCGVIDFRGAFRNPGA